MAWRSSGATNADLINNLHRNNVIQSDPVRDAMLAVDRAHFASAAPYEDSPQPIGFHATISAPHMHAHAAEALLPSLHPGARILDVGSGSGYLTAVLAHLVSPGGVVVGIDHIQGLVDLAVKNMGKSEEGRKMMENGEVVFVKGDGRKGYVEKGPYDAVHVGAAAAMWHEQLLEQLKPGGRMFIPVEEGWRQHVYLVEKSETGEVSKKKLFGVQYVPLTEAPE